MHIFPMIEHFEDYSSPEFSDFSTFMHIFSLIMENFVFLFWWFPTINQINDRVQVVLDQA